MVALFLAAALAASPATSDPPRAQGRVSVTILSSAEIHFNALGDADLKDPPLEHSSIRGEDGVERTALLVEFE